MAGLLYLQHACDCSDEAAVNTWVENPYWQHFTGETWFRTEAPIDPSSLTRWRKNIGEEGVETMLMVTIDAGRQIGLLRQTSVDRVIVDTTVMPKAIAHPTDSRVDRVMRDIARQVERIEPAWQDKAREILAKAQRILTQRTKDKHKLYAFHAPEVECIAKGKARTRYEFGVKVTIATTLKEGFVVGMRSMPGNPYDGHTLAETLEQVGIPAQRSPKTVIVDRGYRGTEIDGVQILRSGQKRGITRALRRMIKRRSAIEPVIGHMKSDGRLGRSPLKGTLGDALHAVLCGAGHNLRFLIRKLRLLCALVIRALGASFDPTSGFAGTVVR